MAKVKIAAGKAATGQQTLSVRERQVIGAVFGAVDKIESTTPGAIYSSEIFVGRRGLQVKVVYNRDRGVAVAGAQTNDGAGIPAQARSKPTKPAAGKPKAHTAAGSGPNAPADKAGLERRGRLRKQRGGDADKPLHAADALGSTALAADQVAEPIPIDPDAPISAAEAEEMRSVIAHRVAHHAQAAGLAAGGDGARLLGEKQSFKSGNHKTRGIRLLRGSPAADMAADVFCAAAEDIILAARPRGGIRSWDALDDQSLLRLDAILVRPADVTPLNDEMEQDKFNLFE